MYRVLLCLCTPLYSWWWFRRPSTVWAPFTPFFPCTLYIFCHGVIPWHFSQSTQWPMGVAIIRLQSPVSILRKHVVITVHLDCFKRIQDFQCWVCLELSCMNGNRCSHILHGNMVQSMSAALIALSHDNCMGNLLLGLDTGDANKEMLDSLAQH